MLQKSPKPQYLKFIRSGAKVLFVIEAGLFAVSYGIWYRMNTSRDFRYYMNENYSYILDGFYKVEEMLSSTSNTRNMDLTIWTKEGKVPKQA